MRKNLVIFLMFLFSINIFAHNLPFYAPQQAIIRIKKDAYASLSFQKFQRPFIITSNAQLNGLFAQLKVYRMERLLPEEENTPFGIRSGINRSFVIYFESQQALDNILDLLRSNAAIEHATPNFLYSTSDVIPNDTHYDLQWSLPKISMPQAWEIEKGNATVRIAILDVGFKLDHEDLSSKFSSIFRRDETDINTAAYESLGYTLIEGEDYTTPDNDPTGKGTHGTHVAGIAAAATNNNKGIAGVGWNNILVPVRCGFQIISPYSESIGLLEKDDWIRALNWVRTQFAARVVNMSFGRSYDSGSDTDEEQAILEAINAGIVICASSGNNSDDHVGYPARYKNVIGVGATNQSDQRANFSNYGDSLDIVAPGVEIYSTYFDNQGNSTYDYESGTSMAAPHVAGAAALILSSNESLSPTEVEHMLENGADKVQGMNGQDFHPEYGYGRLNVFKSLPLSFVFINRISGTENYGHLIVDNDLNNPVPSGESRLFPQNTQHVVRTEELPFIPDWQNSGKTYKHHRFYNNNPDYSLNHQFTSNTLTPTVQDANFEETKVATIKNYLLSSNETGGNIELRDPWRYYQDGSGNWQQSNQFMSYTSPFIMENDDINDYGGVFLNQSGPNQNWEPPYYSVKAEADQTIEGTEYFFLYWMGDGVDFKDYESCTTPVVFKQDGAVAKAIYKGHLRSNQNTAYHINSQHKLIYAPDGYYYTTYYEKIPDPTTGQDMNRLWLTRSSDFVDWTKEALLYEGTMYEARNASLDYDPDAGKHELLIAVEFYNTNVDKIYLITYDTNTGTVKGSEGISTVQGPSYPVVAAGKYNRIVVWHDQGGYLKYRRKWLDDQSHQWEWQAVSNVPGSDGHSVHPSLYVNKTLNSNYKFYLVWDEGVEDKIQYVEIMPSGSNLNFSSVSTISSGSGFSQNQYPSISIMENSYPIVSWVGRRWQSGGGIGKATAVMSPPGGEWVYKAVVRTKNTNGWGSFFSSGSAVNYTHCNSSQNTSQEESVITYSYSNGAGSKYIRRINGNYSIGNLSAAGLQTQVSNGNTIGDLKALVFKSDQLPYKIIPCSNDFSQGLSKTSNSLNRTGRGVSVVYGSVEFVYYLEGVSLEDQDIAFRSWSDSSALQSISLTTLEQGLSSEDFYFQSGSILNYPQGPYMVHGDKVASVLKGNDQVTFELQLVSATSEQVVAVLSKVNYSLETLPENEAGNYKISVDNIKSGRYYLRIKVTSEGSAIYGLTRYLDSKLDMQQQNYQGNSLTGSILPEITQLHTAYPNPFNPQTHIRYDLAQDSHVQLKVYDLKGSLVRTLVDGFRRKGRHLVEFDGSHLASGIYIYRLSTDKGFVQSRKMMLIK